MARIRLLNSHFYIRHLLAVVTFAGVEFGLIRAELTASNRFAGSFALLGVWLAVCYFGYRLLGVWPWNDPRHHGQPPPDDSEDP